jgi:hypothetical protein
MTTGHSATDLSTIWWPAGHSASCYRIIGWHTAPSATNTITVGWPADLSTTHPRTIGQPTGHSATEHSWRIVEWLASQSAARHRIIGWQTRPLPLSEPSHDHWMILWSISDPPRTTAHSATNPVQYDDLPAAQLPVRIIGWQTCPSGTHLMTIGWHAGPSATHYRTLG